jgi:trehalose 6-phosphate phosphatase
MLLPHGRSAAALALLRDRVHAHGPANVLLLLDYDGTLAPIVCDPAAARPEPGVVAVLARLLARFPATVIITGRSAPKVRAFLGDGVGERVQLAAAHGHALEGPLLTAEIGVEHLPALAAAAAALQLELQGVPGAAVEDNRFSVSVHFRCVPPERVADVHARVAAYMAAVGTRAGLVARAGNCVVELRPGMAWDKGRAAALLVGTLGMDRPDATVIAIGDDQTDEDTFRALRADAPGLPAASGTAGALQQPQQPPAPPRVSALGFTVIVCDDGAAAGADGAATAAVAVPRETAASYALRNPADVCLFLEALLAL